MVFHIGASSNFPFEIRRPRREGNGDVWQRPESQKAAGVGTTAEIFSVKEDEKYGVVNLTMKAEGRQRFKVLETKRQIDGLGII